uniref:Uncharacterized protein n=1 Tax=Oryza brachyantha TaxID=4533 RepID=J3LWP1_ORYBR
MLFFHLRMKNNVLKLTSKMPKPQLSPITIPVVSMLISSGCHTVLCSYPFHDQ